MCYTYVHRAIFVDLEPSVVDEVSKNEAIFKTDSSGSLGSHTQVTSPKTKISTTLKLNKL